MEAALGSRRLVERALADPVAYADYVIAFQGDPVWTAAHDRHLDVISRDSHHPTAAGSNLPGTTDGCDAPAGQYSVITQVNARAAGSSPLR